MYKYEIHLHTRSCSACSVSTAEEMIDAAKENGYSGIVITNHFYNGNTGIDRNLPWEEFVAAYARDYYSAREYGEKNGIKVFFGVEECYAPGKEMLIYGLSPETFASCPEFATMTAEQKTNFVHKNKGITVCAHPFRDREYIPNPEKEPDVKLFDAIECYNHFNKPEENVRAFIFTKNSSLVMLSGGDIHRDRDFGIAGIAFKKEIKTYKQFVENIKKGEFRLLSPYSN